MCRRVASCFLLIVLLGVVLAAFLVYRATRPAHGPNAALARRQAAPPTESEKRSAQAVAERLRERTQAPRRPRRGRTRHARPRRDVEFRVTDSEVNELLHAHPEVRKALARYHLSAPYVQFKPGRLLASARVPVVAGMQARVTATGRVYRDRNGLAYETEEVKLGDLPAPKPLRQALDGEIRKAIDQLNEKVGERVEDVVVSEGELRVREKP